MPHYLALLLALVLVTALYVAYSLIETRINQRACAECGFKVSIDSPAGDCARCQSNIDQEWRELSLNDPFSRRRLPSRLLRKWPGLVFACVPLAIAAGAGGLLLAEHSQSEADKAIRLVKESNSRKENFTVQQYLYATVYHRREQGEPMTIEGWRAYPSDSGAPIKIEFSYSDADGLHLAAWEANLKDGRVIPRNEIASDISWH